MLRGRDRITPSLSPAVRSVQRAVGPAPDLRQAPSKEVPLRLVAGELIGAAVGERRLRPAVEPAEQVGPRRVEEVVVVEQAAVRDPVDKLEATRRAIDHRDRDGAIERDDRGRSHRLERVVERAISTQSVSAAVGAAPWTAAIAAWTW